MRRFYFLDLFSLALETLFADILLSIKTMRFWHKRLKRQACEMILEILQKMYVRKKQLKSINPVA